MATMLDILNDLKQGFEYYTEDENGIKTAGVMCLQNELFWIHATMGVERANLSGISFIVKQVFGYKDATEFISQFKKRTLR